MVMEIMHLCWNCIGGWNGNVVCVRVNMVFREGGGSGMDSDQVESYVGYFFFTPVIEEWIDQSHWFIYHEYYKYPQSETVISQAADYRHDMHLIFTFQAQHCTQRCISWLRCGQPHALPEAFLRS